jgi:hypothetical protein
MATATITKRDAARRQLEAAVLLYFNERDPLPIHTLAAAAQGVLETLVVVAGKSTPLQDSLGHFPLDLAQEVRQAMRGPQNFLKHADRDPDASLEYSPDLTEFILYDAVAAYMRLTGDQPLVLNAFLIWFAIHHSDWFAAADGEMKNRLQQGRKYLVGGHRIQFLTDYIAHATRLRP